MSDRPKLGKIPFLPYLEGLRGLGALYIVIAHIRHSFELHYEPFGPSADLLPFRGQFILYAHYGVGMFMVLSGFVLALPVAVRGHMSGGWRKFFVRRARRLLPAYYAALTLSIPLFLYHLAQDGAHTTPGNLAIEYVVHAAFIQNFFTRTIYAIDGPLWSVATEIQIYIIFVFVLLPIVRKAGLLASTVFAFIVGFLPTIVGALRHQTSYQFQLACFWYLGLFALGVAAAYISYDVRGRYDAFREKVPWKSLCIGLFALFVILVLPYYDERSAISIYPEFDVLMGLVIATGFIAVAKDQGHGKRSIFATVLSWKPFVWLGTFSYSIYLIHNPIVEVVMKAVNPMTPLVKVTVGYLLVPFIVLVAYLFGRVFELPFVSTARREADHAVIHASDAPMAVAAMPVAEA